jgi:hypothetical protein
VSEKKVEGGTLWNTPAGSLPSPFAQLDLNAPIVPLSPEEIAKIEAEIEERTRPYRTQSYRDPTRFWNKHSRYGR